MTVEFLEIPSNSSRPLCCPRLFCSCIVNPALPSRIFTIFGIHFFIWWILRQGRWITRIWLGFEILRHKS
ncbi:hypothetical protein IC582_029864 [Cucumis melo]